MRKSKKVIIISFIILIVIPAIFITFNYVQYRKLKIDNVYTENFRHSITETVNKGENFKMAEITDFKWDKMYYFGPYSDDDRMKSEVGLKWTNFESFYGYMFDKYIISISSLTSDQYYKIIFVNNNKVIMDTIMSRSDVQFEGFSLHVTPDDSEFTFIKPKTIKKVVDK